MMENKEELQNFVADLRSKLGDNVHVELIGDDEIAREQQSQPGQALPPELIAEISQAAEALAKTLFSNGVVETQMTQISPMDGSAASKEALKSLLKRMKPGQAKCYHYVLDDNNQPVHCEDDEETHRFQQAKKDILITQVIDCIGIEMRLTTRLVVHNPVESNEIPKPHWVTELFREYTAELVSSEVSHSISEAWQKHRTTCEEIERSITKESAEGEAGNG